MSKAAWDTVATFGFGALMAVWIFFAYQALVRQVVTVVQENTKAMQSINDTLQKLSEQVRSMDDRVSRMEHQGQGRFE